jgi:hypothetical protein
MRLAAVLALLLIPLAPLVVTGSASATSIATITTLTASPTPFGTFGDPVEYVATITADTGTPTGTVTFTADDGTVLGANIPVGADGTARIDRTIDYTGPYGITAAFHGTNGYGDSSDWELFSGQDAGVVLTTQPTIAKVGLGGLTLTFSMAARATTYAGRPLVGTLLVFSVFGHQPSLFDFGGGKVVCRATTDAHGWARCGGSVGRTAAVLSLLALGSYVTHFQEFGYAFSSAKAPIIGLG